MNVLLFVTCFLMMLSMLTYAKIDAFRYFLGTQAQFERYISTIENGYGKKIAEKWYDTTIANKKASPSKTQNTPAKQNAAKGAGRATPRLCFRIIIDNEMQAKNRPHYELVRQWTKNLLNNLYGKYAFFQEALKKNPSFLDELLEQIARATVELPVDQRPSQTSELANLELSPDFADVFYLMLKGSPNLDSQQKKELHNASLTQAQSSRLIFPEGESEDENDIAELAIEEPILEGYDSLLNYISLQNSCQIRLYLASKEVLEAVFGNAQIAENAIERRYTLYQAVLQGMAPAEATTQFKSEFESFIKGSDENIFDFKVSKTNPLRYN